MINKSWFRLALGLGIALALAAAVTLFLRKPITLEVDGQPRSLITWRLTVGGALQSAGVAASPADRLDPPASAWVRRGMVIHLDHARPVTVFYRGVPLQLTTSERRVSALLAQAGVPLAEGDEVYLDGQRVLPDLTLPPAPQSALQVRIASIIQLTEGDQTREIRSTAATLGAALWESGVRLNAGDWLSQPAATPLEPQMSVTLTRAVPMTIQVGDHEIRARSAAQTVGAALADAGIALQGLDFSVPAENEPVPAGGQIRVTRVREDITLKQTLIPFKNEYQPDANTDLDTKRVVQPGQPGIKVTRERVRYENGQETSRQAEAEWVASEPKTQIVGVGTRAAIKTMDTPDGPIEYYRAVSVYATSYSPCRQGMGKCSKSTSSGIPLTKGIVAVTLPWYRQFAGERIYVPGYGFGVIADVGGGIPGKYWVDLGYDEENFINWHDTVTIYFLTPVPANVPAVLP